MKKYFFKVNARYSPKNNLYLEIKDYVLALDGTLITGDDALNGFRNLLRNAVVKLNRKHHRCHPAEINFHQFKMDIDDMETVSLNTAFHASIYLVKNEI
jgi:hypothetical protein